MSKKRKVFWTHVEDTLYGFRKARIEKRRGTGRYRIKFYTLKGMYLYTGYYKSIPQSIDAMTV